MRVTPSGYQGGVMIKDCWLLCILVGGFNPNHLKNMLDKLDHFPK